MTDAERRWLASARSALAAHWNVLSALRAESLPYLANSVNLGASSSTTSMHS
jgi:hypothetical protein